MNLEQTELDQEPELEYSVVEQKLPGYHRALLIKQELLNELKAKIKKSIQNPSAEGNCSIIQIQGENEENKDGFTDLIYVLVRNPKQHELEDFEHNLEKLLNQLHEKVDFLSIGSTKIVQKVFEVPDRAEFRDYSNLDPYNISRYLSTLSKAGHPKIQADLFTFKFLWSKNLAASGNAIYFYNTSMEMPHLFLTTEGFLASLSGRGESSDEPGETRTNCFNFTEHMSSSFKKQFEVLYGRPYSEECLYPHQQKESQKTDFFDWGQLLTEGFEAGPLVPTVTAVETVPVDKAKTESQPKHGLIPGRKAGNSKEPPPKAQLEAIHTGRSKLNLAEAKSPPPGISRTNEAQGTKQIPVANMQGASRPGQPAHGTGGQSYYDKYKSGSTSQAGGGRNPSKKPRGK